jgi:hypothetical protein
MKKLFALFALLLAIPVFAADINGKWKATSEGPDGQTMEITFEFKVAGAEITGTASGPMGDMKLTEIKLDGDNLSFAVENDMGKIMHKAVVKGDDMTIKVSFGDRDMEMKAKRVK